MAKGSGTTKSSSSASPKGLSSSAIVKEGKSLGVSSSVLNMFVKAESYGSFKNAPESFQKTFSNNAAQSIMDIEKKIETKARATRDAQMDKAFNGGGRVVADAAREKYNETMDKVRAYLRKLNAIQNKFNS